MVKKSILILIVVMFISILCLVAFSSFWEDLGIKNSGDLQNMNIVSFIDVAPFLVDNIASFGYNVLSKPVGWLLDLRASLIQAGKEVALFSEIGSSNHGDNGYPINYWMGYIDVYTDVKYGDFVQPMPN